MEAPHRPTETHHTAAEKLRTTQRDSWVVDGRTGSLLLWYNDHVS